jgi:hypothetical protein
MGFKPQETSKGAAPITRDAGDELAEKAILNPPQPKAQPKRRSKRKPRPGLDK